MDDSPDLKQYVTRSGTRIYRIGCQVFPHLDGAVYLVLGLDRPTLIDSGSGRPECSGQINTLLAAISRRFDEPFDPASLGRIILTHGHIDHIGGCAELVERTGAEILIHRFDSQMLKDFDARAVMTNHVFTRFLATTGLDADRIAQIIDWFGYRRGRMQSVRHVTMLEDGQIIGGDDSVSAHSSSSCIEVIHTPGHSPGHVCLKIDNLLLSGDHILARTISQQWPESVTPHTGLWHYYESLRRIRQLCDVGQIDCILAGHEPAITDPSQRISTIFRSQQRRLDRIVSMLRSSSQPLNLVEIVRGMYVTQQGSHVLLAFTDVAARVEYLIQQGLVAVANINEIESSGMHAPVVYRFKAS